MFEARDVSVSWQGAPVIDHASLNIGPGEVVALVGANGAGKSSLIRSLLGLAAVAGGQVIWNGKDVTRKPFHARTGMAYVPEGRLLAPRLTVRETLRLASGQVGATARAGDIDAALARFPLLKGRLDQPAGTLSGGEAQMLSLARALAARPRLILLDEPTLGLSPAAATATFATLRDLRAEGIGLLLTDQDSRAAVDLADRAFLLEDRRLRPLHPTEMTPIKEPAPCSA